MSLILSAFHLILSFCILVQWPDFVDKVVQEVFGTVANGFLINFAIGLAWNIDHKLSRLENKIRRQDRVKNTLH